MLLEHGRLLELAADADLRDARLGQAQQVDGLAQVDAAGDVRVARTGLAGDHIHHRGLAGAVGADHTAQLAVVDR